MSFLTFACSGLAISTHAQTWTDRLYVDVFGGFSTLSDTSFEDSSTTEAEFSGGTLFGIGLGYEIDANWAVELEFFYRTNDADSLSGGTYGALEESDYASTNLMLNAVYSFSKKNGTPLWGKVTPFVGLGIGFLQEVDVDFTVDGLERSFSDSWVPTAQIMGGLEYFWDKRWSLFIEGRYQLASSVDLSPETNQGSTLGADYDSTSFLTGIRFRF
ncbi:MAG: porin family protein [Opitutales bacterium]|nr:porin family protein [Opitutales bacterium]